MGGNMKSPHMGNMPQFHWKSQRSDSWNKVQDTNDQNEINPQNNRRQIDTTLHINEKVESVCIIR